MLKQAHKTTGITRVEWILFCTAFAAGAVDIFGFVQLGSVFASAMTGNLALLAYHVAEGNTLSAIGSVIALCGFVTGCVIGFSLRRGRSDRTTINLLLGAETGLLLLFAVYALYTLYAPSGTVAADLGVQTAVVSGMRLQILILAVAMGLQAVVGQMTTLSTIVFTTTLTRLVGGITDAIATADSTGLHEVRVQIALVASYLLGALLAGVLAVHKIHAGVFLPLLAVAMAFTAHCFFRTGQSQSVQS
jgi:uncharacterized membrane protein YoaK (UPF0700 family)